MDNLELWGKVEKTEPSATKVSNFGGRRETSINGTYMFKQATEMFGPVGIGWGYDVAEERIEKGHPITFDSEGEPQDHQCTHTIKLKLWYELDGKRGEITSYGHTPYIRMTTNGIHTDGEAPKKSLTDAIKKALSMLGFSADIFMGQFDDQEYVQELLNEEAIKKADDKDAEKLRQIAEYTKWKENNLAAIDKAVSLNEVKGLYTAAVRKANRRGDETGVIAFEKAKERAEKRLEEANETA